MKHLFIISLFLVSVTVLQAQDKKMTRKEKKAAQKAEQIEKTKALIDAEAWQFDASQMLPLQGKSKTLITAYNVVLKDNTIDSYLPYYGRAYRADYGSTDSPMRFKSDISKYSVEEWEKGGWIIKFSAQNKSDNLDFTFIVSDTGSTTLSVNSTNRQGISYYGELVEIENNEKEK